MLNSGIFFMNIVGVACLNVALKKPTYASSQRHPADTVVDGVKGFPCFCTKPKDFKQWFMVDLQAVYVVLKVKVINRPDFYHVQLHDIRIEMFKVKPSPRSKTGKLCYDHRGPVGHARTFSCRKGAIGRFLKITKRPIVDYPESMDLCEVEVEANKMSSPNIKTTEPMPITTTSSMTLTTMTLITSKTSMPVTTTTLTTTTTSMPVTTTTLTTTTTSIPVTTTTLTTTTTSIPVTTTTLTTTTTNKPITTTTLTTSTTNTPITTTTLPTTVKNRVVTRGSRCLRVQRRPPGRTIPSSLVIALQDCPRTCRNTRRSDDGARNGMSCTIVSDGSAEAPGKGSEEEVNVFNICTCLKDND